MIADISHNAAGHEPLLETIALQAARAPRRQLLLLLLLATTGTIAAAAAVPHRFSLALAVSALCAAAAFLVLWELCRRSANLSVRVRISLQYGLAVLGILSWFLGGLFLLLVMLGDPWQL